MSDVPAPRAVASVLVVVDMQNGFLHPRGSCARAGFPVQSLAGVASRCRAAITSARRAQVPVVFTRYTYRPDFKDGGFMLKEKFPMLEQAGALVAGTWDQAILEELEPATQDFIVDKNRPSAFYGTPLESYLKGLGITEAVVCGVTTSCCVETTIRDAAQRDLRTFLLSDAVAEWDDDRNLAAIRTMSLLFAHTLTVAELEEAWA